MPTMRLLIVRIFPSLSGSTARSYPINSRSDASKSAYARASSRRQSHVLSSGANGGKDADDMSGQPPFPLRTLTSGTTVGHVRSMSPTLSIPPGAIRMEKDFSVVSTPQVPPVAAGRSSIPTDSDDDQTRLVIMGNNDLSRSESVRSTTNAKRK